MLIVSLVKPKGVEMIANRPTWRVALIVGATMSMARGFQGSRASDHPLLHDLIDDYRTATALATACLERRPTSEIVASCTALTGVGSSVEQLERWSEEWYRTQITQHRDVRKEPVVKSVLKAKSKQLNTAISEQLRKQFRILLDRLARCQQIAAHEELASFCKTDAMTIQQQLDRVVRY